ncbi:hypothetical protein PFISCL1PPCAC_27805, partial [Pristionchus fissidentatus]
DLDSVNCIVFIEIVHFEVEKPEIAFFSYAKAARSCLPCVHEYALRPSHPKLRRNDGHGRDRYLRL